MEMLWATQHDKIPYYDIVVDLTSWKDIFSTQFPSHWVWMRVSLPKSVQNFTARAGCEMTTLAECRYSERMERGRRRLKDDMWGDRGMKKVDHMWAEKGPANENKSSLFLSHRIGNRFIFICCCCWENQTTRDESETKFVYRYIYEQWTLNYIHDWYSSNPSEYMVA